MGRIFTVEFTDVAVTAQQDLFQCEALIVPAWLHMVEIGQISDVGDAQAENLSILIRRVTDVVGDDLATAQADSGDAVQNADVAINETTELVTAAKTYHAGVWNIALPFVWMPTPEMRCNAVIGDVFVVNLNTTPSDSLTMSGTLYFEESG